MGGRRAVTTEAAAIIASVIAPVAARSLAVASRLWAELTTMTPAGVPVATAIGTRNTPAAGIWMSGERWLVSGAVGTSRIEVASATRTNDAVRITVGMLIRSAVDPPVSAAIIATRPRTSVAVLGATLIADLPQIGTARLAGIGAGVHVNLLRLRNEWDQD